MSLRRKAERSVVLDFLTWVLLAALEELVRELDVDEEEKERAEEHDELLVKELEVRLCFKRRRCLAMACGV